MRHGTFPGKPKLIDTEPVWDMLTPAEQTAARFGLPAPYVVYDSKAYRIYDRLCECESLCECEQGD